MTYKFKEFVLCMDAAEGDVAFGGSVLKLS